MPREGKIMNDQTYAGWCRPSLRMTPACSSSPRSTSSATPASGTPGSRGTPRWADIVKTTLTTSWLQGGYLQGRLKLPRDAGNLRVVLSTVAEAPLPLDPGLVERWPGLDQVHPTILFVVRKGRGNR